jgi:DNA-directed RNA polymerase alpha subunit
LDDFSLAQCKEAIARLKRRIRQLTNADYQSYLKKDIKDLHLPKRAYNCLLDGRLYTVGDILEYGLGNVWKLKGCGEQSFLEIKNVVLMDRPPMLKGKEIE